MSITVIGGVNHYYYGIIEKKEKERAVEERKRQRLEAKTKTEEKKKLKANKSKMTKLETVSKPVPAKINIISSVTIKPSTSNANVDNYEEVNMEISEEAFVENISVLEGLCFICCNNIIKTNVGLRCISCKRQYHRRRLLKKDPKEKNITCDPCKKKEN